ncbi:MAG: hypothetical protein CME71_05135 [Halobacteriovorax sp.]|nr:hypothetical protein [Halobacteriovorax sp.]
MFGSLCPLEDWATLSDFLKSLGISKAHQKRQLPSAKLKRKLRAKEEINLTLNLLNPSLISPEFCGDRPFIIKETTDFLVLHKPAGLHGHALNYEEQDNVLSWMRSQGLGSLLNVGRETHERGLLYRLDQATSGVLIYVKDQKRWSDLRERFHKVAHLKRYVAVVNKMPSEVGHLNAWFDLQGKKVKASLEHRAGMIEGSLFLRVLRQDESGIVLAIDLAHGHRHQIRAHLESLGCPILGDTLYGGNEADRLHLHAYLYQLGEELEACDSDLGFGTDFLDLDSDLKMLSNHSGIIHGR